MTKHNRQRKSEDDAHENEVPISENADVETDCRSQKSSDTVFNWLLKSPLGSLVPQLSDARDLPSDPLGAVSVASLPATVHAPVDSSRPVSERTQPPKMAPGCVRQRPALERLSDGCQQAKNDARNERIKSAGEPRKSVKKAPLCPC